MLTYQVRPRLFRLANADGLQFPAQGEVRFTFLPLQPFGREPGGGRTSVQAVKAVAHFDACTGTHTIESETPLRPLEVIIEGHARVVRLEGNVLTVIQDFASQKDLSALIQSVYFGLPTLLNVEFADPPLVRVVDGRIGEVAFRWELHSWRLTFRTTTQDRQEESFISSWQRIELLSNADNTRLFAALHFFHVAVRLQRQGAVVGEFLAEMILNLSKVLEVLFPPVGDGNTRDAARRGLVALGFSDVEIEADYIPAMALRNEIDVGHVDLGLYKPEHLTLINGYVDRAEEAFRALFSRLLTKIASGEFTVEPYQRAPARDGALAVIERLSRYAERYAL